MIIDDTIITSLAPVLDLHPQDISAPVATKIIKDYPISLAGLLLNDTVKLDASIEGTSRGRLAIALNYVLVDHYEVLQHFLDDFMMTRQYLDRLWSGKTKSARGDLITRLVQDFNVDPLFIIDTRNARLLSHSDTVYRISIQPSA